MEGPNTYVHGSLPSVGSTATARRMLVLGLHNYGRSDLEALGRRGETLHLRVLGLLRFGADVTPQLARKTIASIVLLGAMQASPAVRAALLTACASDLPIAPRASSKGLAPHHDEQSVS